MTWQMHTYGAGEITRPAWPTWIDGPHAFRADPQARLRPDRLYLIWPDGFIAASVPSTTTSPTKHSFAWSSPRTS
jgi:hypothetical protein